MSFHLRRATAADAQALAELSRDTFVEKFGHQYTPEDLQDYLDSTYTAENYQLLLDEQGCAAWVVEDASAQLQGYALCGPCSLPHADVTAGDMELKRLYLRMAMQNGGWGTQLWQAAEGWMRVNGPASIWLGVYSENTDAQRFYQRLGFEPAGEYTYKVGAARDREFIYRKALA